MALGLASGPATGNTVSLNTSICNLDRNTIDPSKYDLLAITEHEIDEVLGMGSALNGLNNGDPAPTGPVWVEDLFRYGPPGAGGTAGARSFATGVSTQAFFSINGGYTDLARFNQHQGGDFSDWYS